MGTGSLQLTNAQNLAAGQSDVFAVGYVTLLSPAKGFYRVFVTAPEFHDGNIKITPSAGGAIVVN